MGCVPQQVVAFMQGFADQAELSIFQVADTPMQHMGGRHTGAGTEISPVND
jgi:hypothetical protein